MASNGRWKKGREKEKGKKKKVRPGKGKLRKKGERLR
jgi:hypothetical protein